MWLLNLHVSNLNSLYWIKMYPVLTTLWGKFTLVWNWWSYPTHPCQSTNQTKNLAALSILPNKKLGRLILQKIGRHLPSTLALQPNPPLYWVQYCNAQSCSPQVKEPPSGTNKFYRIIVNTIEVVKKWFIYRKFYYNFLETVSASQYSTHFKRPIVEEINLTELQPQG